MKLSPIALKKLRARLPRGYQRLTAERLKGRYSIQLVGFVANGQRANDEVLEALIAIAEEHEAKTQEMNARAMGSNR